MNLAFTSRARATTIALVALVALASIGSLVSPIVAAAAPSSTSKALASPAPKRLTILGDGKSAGSVVDGAKKVVPEGWTGGSGASIRVLQLDLQSC